MGSTVFRNPRALSSALAALGTLQPRALGFLNTVDPLDTVSNCYIDSNYIAVNNMTLYIHITLISLHMYVCVAAAWLCGDLSFQGA